MGARAPELRRGLLERAQAWLVTGPLGHFYSVVADLAVFFVRQVLDRVRRALPGVPSAHGRRRGEPS